MTDLPAAAEAEKFLFTKEMVEEIVIYKKTVQLIGIVDKVDFKPKVLKFTLKNAGDEVVQVLVWDEKIIEKIKCHIMSGNIILIDSAYARTKHATLSDGNTKYDLTVMSNTKVFLLKTMPTYQSIKDEKAVIITKNVSIEECVKYEGSVEVIGYIKNIIKETSLPNSKINQGCITDCKQYKLEVRMPCVIDMSEFQLGFHVKIVGIIKYSHHPYLWVQEKKDINFQSKDIKKITDLLKGTKMPYKRPFKSDEDSSNKDE